MRNKIHLNDSTSAAHFFYKHSKKTDKFKCGGRVVSLLYELIKKSSSS